MTKLERLQEESRKRHGAYGVKEKMGKIAYNYLCMSSEKKAPTNETLEEKQARIKAIAEKVNKLLGI